LTVIGGGPSGAEVFARDSPFAGAGWPLPVLRGGVDSVLVAISELMLECLVGSLKFQAR
jgi:hypothetical protein